MGLFCFGQDIFVTLSQLDSDKYFMCNVDDFKFLADMIEHVPLNLRVRYVFCCAPIPKKQPFVCTMFLKVRCIFGGCVVCVGGGWMWYVYVCAICKVVFMHLYMCIGV